MGQRERATVHRALADERRASIVDELDRHPGGLDARELAQLLGLHPNTVRWHLGVLADAGLVGSHTDQRKTPGRPRILYTLSQTSEDENYRLLANVLVSSLSKLPDAGARAYEAGDAWGRYLVDRPAPGERLEERETTQVVADLLAREGFRPEPGDREIRMRRCPFSALVETGDGLVCTLHEGLISGALAEVGDTLELARLESRVGPQLCIARLRPRYPNRYPEADGQSSDRRRQHGSNESGIDRRARP